MSDSTARRTLEEIAETMRAMDSIDNISASYWARTYQQPIEAIAELIRAERSRRKVAA